MKERIYTIPINEAFDQDTECALCVCERKLENDALDYTIGPSMMEPDSRVETNRTGFCTEHFTKLYNLQQNRLALGLVIDTHMVEQLEHLEKLYKKQADAVKKESEKGLIGSALDSLKGKGSSSQRLIDDLLEKLTALEGTCAVCDRITNNMERLIENTIFLYDTENDFKRKFLASKGFCLKHFKQLLSAARKELSGGRQAEFLKSLLPKELSELKRIQDEVNHFTKMFDYRNQSGDWKNSRDAVPRSIEKLCGPCELKR
ncbi:MAG: DUF6062 family protein [Clostridia bacterium]|nr:DUF6062 family protein [Clostridia bacterium]